MSSPWQSDARMHALREAVVPAIMVNFIGLFVYDSAHLSPAALVFPAVLILVILAALLHILTQALMGKADAPLGEAGAVEDDETAGPVLAVRPWLIVGLSAVAVFLFEYLGVLMALVAVVFGAQLILGLKSPLKSFAIAVAVTAPTYYIFKYVLYARFPAGILGIG